MPTLRSATNADGAAVQSLIFGILAEFHLQADPLTTDADLFDLEDHYSARGGRFDVLIDDDANQTIIGTVGLSPTKEPRICELRKMYLSPARRGRGLGKLLLTHALGIARQMGFREVRLETAFALKDAIILYERYGFQPYKPDHCAARCDIAYRLDLL